MLKQNGKAVFIFSLAGLFVLGPFVRTAFAQRSSTPKQENNQALGEQDVKQLLLLMDTDKNGKISREEYMKFMQAEFDRLDEDKNGELDAKELTESRLRPKTFTTVGK